MLVIVLRTTGRKHQKWFASLALKLSKWFLFPPHCYVVCLNSFWLVHVKVITQPTFSFLRIVTCFALMSCFSLICPQLFLCSQIVTSYSFLPLSTIQPSYVFLYLITLWVILSTFTQKFHCPKSSISQKILPIFKWIRSFTILQARISICQ